MSTATVTPPTEIQPMNLDADNAARFIGVSVRKLLELAYGGQIRSVRIGRRRLYRVVDLEHYVERQTA